MCVVYVELPAQGVVDKDTSAEWNKMKSQIQTETATSRLNDAATLKKAQIKCMFATRTETFFVC